jgi:hypothetical protein
MARAREVRYVFEIVPYHKQRYETHGDWIPGEPVRIVSSRLNNDNYEFLLLFHELVEYELCKKRKITDRIVLAFDRKFEAERRKGKHPVNAEPGNSRRAPYRKEHKFAMRMERLMAKQLGVDWKKYSEALVQESGVHRKKAAH